MTQLASAVWLPTLLLLLLLFWLPGDLKCPAKGSGGKLESQPSTGGGGASLQARKGCVPLHGPSTMSGSVGESLSVSCRYEEKFKTKDKYWCRVSLKILCKDIVKTSSSEEARSGRVTIRDHPDNLTFTVTYESLTLEDADTYMCAVDISLFDGSLGFDKYFKIELSVVPSEDPGPTLETPVVSTSLPTKGPALGSNTEGHREHDYSQGLRLPALLSVLALLLFLLVGTSLLAWRMFQKRLVKADRHPELSQNLRQASEQNECQYVNLQLHTWSLREEPVLPSQVEVVEYSTLALPQEELHYSSVAFNSQRQDSHANGDSLHQPQDQKAEYSEIQKPRKGLSDLYL